MSRVVSRRHFTLAAAALAAPVVLPRESLGNDVKVDLVHLFSGAEHPIQKVIKAFNDKGTGVTVVSRQDGTTYETITQKAMASTAAVSPSSKRRLSSAPGPTGWRPTAAW